MLDWLTDPFATAIGQRALLEAIVIGAVCGPLGAWVILYRQSYAAESLAHAMLPGLVLAALAGIPLLLGAAAGLLVAAIAIAAAARAGDGDHDVGVAVVVTALFAAGTLLALSPDAPARLGELLFGDPLSVTAGELAASAGLTAGVLVALAFAHRSLNAAAFDPVSAPNLGSDPGRMGLAVLVLLAVTTLVAVQALGSLLVVALVIAPGAAALQLSRRLVPGLALAAGLAVAAGVGGIYLSHYASVAAGASIALVALAIFAASIPVGRRHRHASPGATVA